MRINHKYLSSFFLCFLAALFLANLGARSLAYAYCDLDFAEVRYMDGGRVLDEDSEIKIGTFNVLNLEFSPGKYIYDMQKKEKVFTPGFISKDQEQVKGVAKAILDEDMDIIVLQEVEGMQPLARFNQKFLGDKYEVFLQSGNDPRGIEIGFLVKKDLPFKIQMHGHAWKQWSHPIFKKNVQVFSRDLPALHIRHKSASMTEKPDFIIAGTHYKSQRSYRGDKRSAMFRAKQVEETRAILEDYDKNYPGVPILLGGDFNADIHRSPEFKALLEDDFMQDSFDLSRNKLAPKERVTQTFHPRKGAAQQSQLDAILVNRSASSAVVEAKVYRYKDEHGREKPLPKTYDERELNPSDHFPVVLRVKTSELLNKK